MNNDRRRFALVFVKLVSLTQTFDSLGTINASRHVASRKEQARGARRQECGSPMAKHAENGRSANDARKNGVAIRINYETVLRVSSFLRRSNPETRRSSGKRENGVEIFFRRRGEKCYVATKNGSTAKGSPLPFTDSCSRAFIKLASTGT